jgi:hypothetical protein
MPASALVSSLLMAAMLQGGVTIRDRRWPALEVQFSATVEQSGQAARVLPGGVRVDGDRVHRTISDNPHKVYFGYDVVLESGRTNGTFQIRIEPLNVPPSEMALLGMNPGWTGLSLPVSPVIPEIRLGATVKLDLLVNPSTGEKIVDSLTVKALGISNSPPREFKETDAELRFVQPQLRVDSNRVSSPDNGGISGAAVWFYVPGHGRFVMSLAPHSGFQKTGEVNGTLLTLHDGPHVIEIESRQPIAPGSGSFFVYVRQDSQWKPSGTSVLYGAADRVEWIR